MGFIPTQQEETPINWNDTTQKISRYFTVGEALYLPSWKVYHNPTGDEKLNILRTAAKLDLVRDHLGISMKIHCWLRPLKVDCRPGFTGQLSLVKPDTTAKVKAFQELNYNAYVGGAPKSAHTLGIAVDFSCKLPADKIRELLLPKLEFWNARMEDLEGSSWVHLDYAPVKSARFFKP